MAPALLAFAELRQVSGPDLLLAFILGNEIQARIGRAVMRDGVIVTDKVVTARTSAKEELRRLDEEHAAAQLIPS